MNQRRFLHRLRRLDAWLVPPALLLVVYGELAHSKLIARLEFDIWDKALHATAYFGLCLMTTIAVRADRRARWWALGLVVMGGVLEILQGMTGRDADIWDEAANTLGVLGGLAVAWGSIAFLKARKLVEDEPAD